MFLASPRIQHDESHNVHASFESLTRSDISDNKEKIQQHFPSNKINKRGGSLPTLLHTCNSEAITCLGNNRNAAFTTTTTSISPNSTRLRCYRISRFAGFIRIPLSCSCSRENSDVKSVRAVLTASGGMYFCFPDFVTIAV